MNRQRRMEAITRRRAIIDNHLQMLASCNEARIPNIMRSRTPRSQVRPTPRYNHSLQLFHQIETVQVDAGDQQQNHLVSEEEVTFSASEQPQVQENEFSVEGLFSEQPAANGGGGEGQVYVTLVNENNDAFNSNVESFMSQNQGNELVPVPMGLKDEIMKMLVASASNEQISNSLQTFRTEDGTVMVVLDGNDFYKQQTESATAAATLENGHTTGATEVMVPAPPPVSLKTDNNIQSTIASSADSEQTYVIVQDAHGGHILIPSSAYPQANVEKENIVELIAAEGAHIEQLMSASNNSVISKTVTTQSRKQQLLKRSAPATKVPVTAALPKTKIVSRHIQQRLRNTSFNTNCSNERPKSISVSNGQRVGSGRPPASHSASSSPSAERKSNPWPIVKEEKPRPFRFELPELEDNLDCNFMSVPVPIQIGNIRSITDRKDDSTHKNKVVSNTVNSNPSKQPVTTDADEKMLETCDTCLLDFHSRKTLVEHIEEMHQELRLFKCEQCDQQYSYESSLINHLRNQHRPKKFQCGRCKKLFQAEATVISHQKYCGSEILNNDESSHKLSDNEDEAVMLNSNEVSEPIEILKNSENETLSNFTIGDSPSNNSLSNATSHIHSLNDANLVTSTNPHIFQQDVSNDPDLNEQYCEDQNVDDENEPPSKVAKILVQNSECDLKVLNASYDADTPTETYSYTIVPNPACSENESTPSDNDFHLLLIESPSVVPETVGRRTLNKASAKANMSNEVFSGTWESHMSGENNEFIVGMENEIAHAQNCDLDGDAVSLRSAKIRARNIRIREMEGKEPNEEEISVNFLNIFQQVVKQSSI